MQQLILDYVRYNHWANHRIIQMVEHLTDQQFTQQIVSSFPSVKLTLLHIWDAQMIWLSRMKGASLSNFPSRHFSGTRQDVTQKLEASSTDFLSFTAALNTKQLEAVCHYKTTSGSEMAQTFAEIIMHCMNHSTYHRGQVVTILRQLGTSGVVATDYIKYLREKKSKI